MQEFHVSSDGKTMTVLSMKTGYSVERPLTTIPPKVIREVHQVFGITPFKPGWSTEHKDLDTSSAIYQWYLYEKSIDMDQRELEMELVAADPAAVLSPIKDPSFEDWMAPFRFINDV